MSPALDALEADLLQERLRHGGHPALAMCAANAVAVPDPAGNRKLEQSKATGRIDGMVALAMAEGVEAMTSENTVSVYDWLASDRKSTRLNSTTLCAPRMQSSAYKPHHHNHTPAF